MSQPVVPAEGTKHKIPGRVTTINSLRVKIASQSTGIISKLVNDYDAICKIDD